MRFTIKAIAAALVFMVILAAILCIGMKWSNANLYNEEIMRLKPWQPMARMALTVVIFTLTCILGGAYIRVTGRDL